jgi:hypothetical protein
MSNSLSEAVQSYLSDLSVNRRSTTCDRANQILQEFMAVTGELPLADVGRTHINSF